MQSNLIRSEQILFQINLRKNMKKNLQLLKKNIIKYPILSLVPLDLLNDICFNFPYLYTFIQNINYEILLKDNSFEILTVELKKEYLANLLKFLDNRLNNINLIRLNKSELYFILIDIIKKPCPLSNFFIQDIFEISSLYKEKYKYNSYIDIFQTTFYYILNCEYKNENVDLKINHKNEKFKFPIDINIDEFKRPVIIIDVANQFNQEFNPILKTYNERIKYLKENMYEILEKLFKIHQEPNLMVLFINQADRHKKNNCPEIINILKWFKQAKFDLLLKGDINTPFDRKVLYITIPCYLFLYPELFYPNKSRVLSRPYYFNNGFDEPGYPKSLGNGGYYERTEYKKDAPHLTYKQEIQNIFYDKYGRMLYNPNIDTGTKTNKHTFKDHYGYNNTFINHIPNYKYLRINDPKEYEDENIFKANYKPYSEFKNLKIADNYEKRHRGQLEIYQGQNKYQNYVKEENECTGHGIHKNEIDDYMIGILLFIHSKIMIECQDYVPFKAKWLVFSRDNYKWLNQNLLKSEYIIKHDNFLQYIENNQKQKSLYISNNNTKILIKDLGLYRYIHDRNKFYKLLQSIIKINNIHG